MRNFFLLIFIFDSFYMSSQSIGIGTPTPDPSAILDVVSTNKGVLVPRMDSASIAEIMNPAQGLMVFQSDRNKGFYFRNGTQWSKVGGGGDAWTDFSTYLYTSRNIFLQGKLGIGTSPTALLHLKGLDGTNNRHIRLVSNSNSDYTSIYAGTNFIVENSSNAGDFIFRNGSSGANVLTVDPTGDLAVSGTISANGDISTALGDLEIGGDFTGAIKLEPNLINITVAGPTSVTFTVGNKTYINADCVSGDCQTCLGMSCPLLKLSDGESDGHIIVIRGNSNTNRGLRMESNNESVTNYRLTSYFQLAGNNLITLIWMSDLNEWREVSRAVY